MKFVLDQEGIVLTLSHAELLIISGSINEALEAVDEWEWSTRVGSEKDDARRLCAEFRSVSAQLRG